MAATTDRRELAQRTTNGVSVALFWESVGDTLLLEVHDEAADDYFALEIPRDRALDAFHHPYVYRANYLAWPVTEPVAA